MGIFSRRDRGERERAPRPAPRGTTSGGYDPARQADDNYRRQIEDDRLRENRLREDERVRRNYER